MIPALFVALALAAPPDATPSALAHRDALAKFGAAVWNARRDRLLTAVRQFEAAAKQDPDATAPLRELVRVYSQVGREPDAVRVAREVLRKDPKDVEIAHALAKLLFDAGELKEAVAAAKLAADGPLPVERADRAVAVYRDLATLCEKADDPAAAEVALGKAVALLTGRRREIIEAVALSPREVDAAAAECLERLGKVQTKLRKFDAAAESFTTAARLSADPASAARLGWNLSGVLQAKGEPVAALEKLRAFLKLRPAAPEPYVRLTQLLRETGADPATELRRLSDADTGNLRLRAVYAAELARSPGTRAEADRLFGKLMTATNDPAVVGVVVRSHLETRRPREVVADLDRAFSVIRERDEDGKKREYTPELAAARAFAAEKARAVAEVVKNDHDAVVALLDAAANDARTGVKRNHGVHYFLGQLAARHRELELAAHHFQHAVRNAPPGTAADAYVGLVTALVQAHKPAELRRVCQEALREVERLPLAPHYFNYYLAGALADLGDARGALAAVDAAILSTAVGDRLTVRIRKVEVLRTLGKWDEAIEFGKKLYDEFDARADRDRIRYALAGAYWGAKRAAEAEAELRTLLDSDPDHAAAANDLGFYLADAGRDLPEAERLVRHALAVDRQDRKRSGSAELESAGYLDSLGWVLFRQGKLAEARSTLERASALQAGAIDPIVWDHLGDVLFRAGEKAKAKAAWEKACELYASDDAGGRAGREGRLDEVRRKLKRVP